MFTGIIEELGRVRANEPTRRRRPPRDRRAMPSSTTPTIGASIAVNGCCLTVVERSTDAWTADVQPESLERTTLGASRPRRPGEPGAPRPAHRPARRAPRPGPRRRGRHRHRPHPRTRRLHPPHRPGRPTASPATSSRRAPSPSTGSASPSPTSPATTFGVALIPHTLAVTTLGVRQPGDTVNLEADVVAKYVERLLTTQP